MAAVVETNMYFVRWSLRQTPSARPAQAYTCVYVQEGLVALLRVINVEFLWPELDGKELCCRKPGGNSCLSVRSYKTNIAMTSQGYSLSLICLMKQHCSCRQPLWWWKWLFNQTPTFYEHFLNKLKPYSVYFLGNICLIDLHHLFRFYINTFVKICVKLSNLHFKHYIQTELFHILEDFPDRRCLCVYAQLFVSHLQRPVTEHFSVQWLRSGQKVQTIKIHTRKVRKYRNKNHINSILFPYVLVHRASFLWKTREIFLFPCWVTIANSSPCDQKVPTASHLPSFPFLCWRGAEEVSSRC